MRGGVAEYTYQLARGLSEAGRLDRVVTTVPQNQESSYGFDVWGPDERYSRDLGERWGDSNLLLRKLNSSVYLCKSTYFRYRAALTLLRHRENEHVLFTWTFDPAARLALSACMRAGIEFSVIFHGYDLILLSKHNSEWLEKICDRAELVVFNSEATRELYRQLCSVPRQQTYILYPGINPAQIDASESTPTPTLERRFDVELQEKTLILSLARLVKRKGIDIAVRALAPILASSEQYRYVIAGDGPEYEALESEIEALGLGDKIRLTGEVTDAEKYGLLETSTLFVMPNHTRGGDDFEGFGISFIEASYFENVVIGGRSGGAVEAIAEDTSGYVLDFEKKGAEEELRSLVGKLLNRPERIAELSAQGRRYTVEHFCAPDLVAEFARWFENSWYS